MFIKQRQVRRSSKFSSRFARTSLRRREYVATLYTTGMVQLFLSLFLFIGAYRSFVVMRDRFGDLPWYGKLALPALMVLIGLTVLRLFIINLRQAIDVYRQPSGPPKD